MKFLKPNQNFSKFETNPQFVGGDGRSIRRGHDAGRPRRSAALQRHQEAVRQLQFQDWGWNFKIVFYISVFFAKFTSYIGYGIALRDKENAWIKKSEWTSWAFHKAFIIF